MSAIQSRWFILLALSLLMVAGCSATTQQIIPTSRPTATATFTVTPTNTPDANVTPSVTPSPVRSDPTRGPSPTPLLGPTRTPAEETPTPTVVLNPNAPRIEFFTSDAEAVPPGSDLTLFWSTRGVTGVSIYRLNRQGERERVWNEGPDGTLTLPTSERERGQIDFLLTAGEGALRVEQPLSIVLACPVEWFFEPSPPDCAQDEAQETLVFEQLFERGRMVYVAEQDIVYALFNDDFQPAWLAFEDRYDPTVHPESDPNFPNLQPTGILGFVWRGNDTVRNRLGVPVEELERRFDGFIQEAIQRDGNISLYISTTGAVLQLIEGGETWGIISVP